MTCGLVSYTLGWMNVPLDLGHRKGTSYGGNNHDFGLGCVNHEIRWRWSRGNFKWEVGGEKIGLELRRRAGLESLACPAAMLEQL